MWGGTDKSAARQKSSTDEMRHLRHLLRHGEAHAAKGLTAFGTSLARNSLFLRATRLIRSGCNGCGQRFRWQDLTCGQANPVFKARLAECRAKIGRASCRERV